MYKILKLNKRFNSKSFESYDEARNYIRKWIRSKFDIQGHPPLKDFDFSIKLV